MRATTLPPRPLAPPFFGMASRTNTYRVLERDIAWKLKQVRLAKKEQMQNRGISKPYNPYYRPNVARKLGVTRQCLGRWEDGLTFPHRLELWLAWCQVLGTSYEDEIAAAVAQALAEQAA